MPARTLKLSPSDFGFLWEECKRCFYLKVARGFDRPSAPFPRIFNVIDKQMKERFQGKRTETMAPDMPKGRVHKSDEWVQSVPIERPGKPLACYIRGILDTTLALDGGGYAVIDFKTTTIGPDQAVKYARQLEAYALALEQPAPGNLALAPVRELGLLAYEPTAFDQDGAGNAALKGALLWIPVRRDPGRFLRFLDEVLDILALAEPPPPSPSCKLCTYRAAARTTGF